MAFIQCDFFSEALGLSSSMSVILPQQTEAQIGLEGKAFLRPYPTLFLLHGLSDDHTIWMRRTSIERYVAPLGIAVVMPAVHRSFYTDMAYGMKFWTFVADELPRIARTFFPLSERREDTFVAGLSMGGFGAFKLGLNRPDQYAAAGSFSGVLDLVDWLKHSTELGEDWRLIFGNASEAARDVSAKISGTENDLPSVMEAAVTGAVSLPDLYQCCGTEDFLYRNNLRFLQRAGSSDVAITYEWESGASHSWDYWDRKIGDFLSWLRNTGHLRK